MSVLANRFVVILFSGLLVTAVRAEPNLVRVDNAFGSLKELADEINDTIKTETIAPRKRDDIRAARGLRLYSTHCIRCHRDGGEGAPDWHKIDPSGNSPPPPLNGTAHTWHHPMAHLLEIIRGGSRGMPAFGGKLSDAQITDIIHWFQSLWPDDVYAAWARINKSYDDSIN